MNQTFIDLIYMGSGILVGFLLSFIYFKGELIKMENYKLSLLESQEKANREQEIIDEKNKIAMDGPEISAAEFGDIILKEKEEANDEAK